MTPLVPPTTHVNAIATRNRDPRVPTARSPRRSIAAFALATVALALPATTASAQGIDERRLDRIIRSADPSIRQPLDYTLSLTERSFFDAGGFLNFTYLNLNDSNDNSRRLFQPEASLYARAVIDGAHGAFIRTRFRYRDFSPGDSFDRRGDGWQEPYLERYWYEYDAARSIAARDGQLPDWNFNIRVGRQFVDWGAGLALSEQIIGVLPTLSLGPRWKIEGIAGLTPPDRGVIDFDASRSEYNRKTKRGFFGGKLAYTTPSNHEFYAFGLHMQDFNKDTNPRLPIGVPVDFTYNATYVGLGTQGTINARWAYLAEVVYQFGESMSDPLRSPSGAGEQRTEDISAAAARAQLNYFFRDEANTTVELETLFATGDDDRITATDTVGGNRVGTTDTAFNSLGFANTGLAFAPSLTNLAAVRLGARSSPFPEGNAFDRLRLGTDAFLFFKLDSNAPIAEPTSDDAYLGFEIDVFAAWRLTSDLSIGARYGLFIPGNAIENDDLRHFVLFNVTLAF